MLRKPGISLLRTWLRAFWLEFVPAVTVPALEQAYLQIVEDTCEYPADLDLHEI